MLAQDPSNGAVTAYSAYALGALGEAERAKERMNRALLIDPDNWNMRYNFGCVLIIHLKEIDAALDMLAPAFGDLSIAASMCRRNTCVEDIRWGFPLQRLAWSGI